MAARQELCWTARHKEGERSEIIELHEKGGMVPFAVLSLQVRLGINYKSPMSLKGKAENALAYLNKPYSILQEKSIEYQ